MKNFIADPNNPKILIVGGHMTPALAVITEIEAMGYHNLVWVGHKHSQIGDENLSAEYKTIISKGIQFENLVSGKLFRVWNFSTIIPAIKSLFRIPVGIINAFIIVNKNKPKIVLSFGGYLAVPIAFAAYCYGIPIVTHEQTLHAGLANKIVSFFAKKVFISWKDNEKYFDKSKVIFTGNPIRNQIFEIKSQNINFYNKLPIIYVTGGNQGSQNINECIFRLAPSLLNEFNIIHQTGSSSLTHDYEKAIAIKANLSDELAERYHVSEYFSDTEIGEVFNKSSLVIARSGLNTCSELLALNKISVLIPIKKTSKNEQYNNAKLLEKLGLSICLAEDQLTPENLNRMIYKIYDLRSKNKNSQNEPWTQTLVQTRMYVKKDAAEKIAEETLILLKETSEK